MPKLDISSVTGRIGVGYPHPFDRISSGRVRQRFGEVADDCAVFPKEALEMDIT